MAKAKWTLGIRACLSPMAPLALLAIVSAIEAWVVNVTSCSNAPPIPGGKELCLFPLLEGIGKFLREQPSPVAPVPVSPAHHFLGPDVLRKQVSSALSRS